MYVLHAANSFLIFNFIIIELKISVQNNSSDRKNVKKYFI